MKNLTPANGQKMENANLHRALSEPRDLMKTPKKTLRNLGNVSRILTTSGNTVKVIAKHYMAMLMSQAVLARIMVMAHIAPKQNSTALVTAALAGRMALDIQIQIQLDVTVVQGMIRRIPPSLQTMICGIVVSVYPVAVAAVITVVVENYNVFNRMAIILYLQLQTDLNTITPGKCVTTFMVVCTPKAKAAVRNGLYGPLYWR